MLHDIIVKRVIDGDTFDGLVTIEVEEFDIEVSKVVRFRMNGINAPEVHGEEKTIGDQAKAWIKQMIEGKEIQVMTYGKDKYGRTLVDVILEGHDVGTQMISAGMAERYKGHVGTFGKPY